MPIRILIADDNEVFRKALRQLLEGIDQWEIVEARDGQEAVSKTLELRPNLVILDLAMPVKDGLTAAREISQVLPDIPLLMCTMHMAPQLKAEAQKASIREVFSKTESSLLVPAIRQLLAPVLPQASSLVEDPIPPPVVPSTVLRMPSTANSVGPDDPASAMPPIPRNDA